MGKTETKINTIYLSSGVSIDDDRNGAAFMTSSRRSILRNQMIQGSLRLKRSIIHRCLNFLDTNWFRAWVLRAIATHVPGFSTKRHTNLFPDGVVSDVGLPVAVGRGREIRGDDEISGLAGGRKIREDDEVLGSVGGWEI